MRFSVLLAICGLALSMSALRSVADAPLGDGAHAGSKDEESAAEAVEVVTVVGERTKLNAADRRRIYEDLATGHKLYADNKIKEAFPYLLNTAERGFKNSQATVSHIYAYGLGEVERDTSQAVGWLGVAADGVTSGSVKNYFRTVWKRIPEQHVPYFEEVVEEFKAKYGERATGVVCDAQRPIRTHIKRLSCYFKEDLDDQTRDDLTDYFAGQRRVAEAAVLEEQQRILQQTTQVQTQDNEN